MANPGFPESRVVCHLGPSQDLTQLRESAINLKFSKIETFVSIGSPLVQVLMSPCMRAEDAMAEIAKI
jgi:hypothetical protein